MRIYFYYVIILSPSIAAKNTVWIYSPSPLLNRSRQFRRFASGDASTSCLFPRRDVPKYHPGVILTHVCRGRQHLELVCRQRTTERDILPTSLALTLSLSFSLFPPASVFLPTLLYQIVPAIVSHSILACVCRNEKDVGYLQMRFNVKRGTSGIYNTMI